MKLIAVTIGFQTTLVLRSLLRHSVEKGDLVYVIAADTTDEYARAKVINAVKDIESVVGNINVIYVKPSNLVDSVKALVNMFNKANEVDEVLLVLSGGMRALLIEVLLTAIHKVPSTKKTIIHAELENLENYIEIPLNLLKINISREEKEILRTLKESPMNLSELSRTLGKPKTTIFRKLRKLINLNLVDRRNNNYSVNKWGEIILSLE